MVSDRNQTIIRERCSLWKSGVHSLKGEYHAPNELLYTKEHEWVRLEADKCRIGVTDYAQASLHEIVYVDLPKVGAKVAQMQSLGTAESVKSVASSASITLWLLAYDRTFGHLGGLFLRSTMQ